MRAGTDTAGPTAHRETPFAGASQPTRDGNIRIRTILSGALALFVALALAGYLVLRSLDLDDYKGVVAAEVKEITSRDLDIKGHITFSISLKPTITARDLSLANAAWASQPTMLDIDRLDITLDLIGLLFGTLDTTEVTITGGRLSLERGAGDQVNWQLGLDRKDVEQTEDYLVGPFPYIHAIRFEDFDVDYADQGSGTKLSGYVKSFDATFEPKEHRLRTNLDAKVHDQSVAASGSVANFLSLHDGGTTAVDLAITLGQTKLSFDGSLDAGAGSLDGTFQAVGPGPGDLATLAGVTLPDLGAVKAGGKIALTATALDLTALDARIGGSDFHGEAKIGLGKIPSFTVDLSSKQVDVTPFVEHRQHEDAAPAEKPAERGFLFSDRPLFFDKLPPIEADVKLAADKLVIGELILDAVLLRVEKSDRALKVDPFKVVYKGATFTGRGSVEAAQPPKVSLKILTQNFDLGSFLAQQGVTDLVQGEIDIGIDVRGEGNSLHALAGSLEGAASFVMADGHIASRDFDLIATDLLPRLMPWRKEPKETYIKCALAQLEVKTGKAKTRSFMFDTRQMIVTGKGKIHLKSEELHLRLRPRPKDPTLISLATGLVLKGNLRDIKVSLDPESLLISAAEGAVGVWLLGPAGILVPFASLGAGHHHPCVNDLQKIFGTQVSDPMGDGEAPASLSAGDPESASQPVPVPTTIRIALTKDEVSSTVMKRHLTDLGFSDITKLDKDGGIFHVDADWQGQPLTLRIDARRGTIEHSAR